MTTDENTTIPVKREKNGSVHCTVTFTEEQVKASEEKAIKTMGEKVKIDGFRPGKAPAESRTINK